jgi:hypothetical protein
VNETTFHCANPYCQAPLGADHVILLTTMHMRRFCTVECIAVGKKAHDEEIWRELVAGQEQEE